MSSFPAEKILAESRNYTVISEFESVYLKRTDGTKLLIGDFYGDPTGALIDPDERFVIMYGCGLIVYYLRPPFEEYSYGLETDQWYEFGRDEPVRWIENVVQSDKNSFQFTCESGENFMVLRIEYSYRVIKSTWGIAIDIKGLLSVVKRESAISEQFQHIQGCIFCQMPDILNVRECDHIKSGIKMMYKAIVDNCSVGKDEVILISLSDIRYNPCDYQEEGMKAAMIMCFQEMFRIDTVKINTTFDSERKRYCFEYIL